MRSTSGKDKAPLIGLRPGSEPTTATSSASSTSHEFVNPFVDRVDGGEEVAVVNKLRTEDPFEIYNNPTEEVGESLGDPFDTSQVLNPFGFPNPLLFRAADTTTARLPVDTPASLKSSAHAVKVIFAFLCLRHATLFFVSLSRACLVCCCRD